MLEDEKIVELFFARDERAIRELDAKYGRACYNLSYNILNSRTDAEECVNDAYLGLWNAIPPAKPDPLPAYLFKVVRNLSLKLYHAKGAAKRNSAYDIAMEEIEPYLPSALAVEAEVDAKELAREIEGFLDTLPTENRVIFLRRYWFADTYSDIARRVGITEKNVSVRLSRMRKQLRDYLTEREVLI